MSKSTPSNARTESLRETLATDQTIVTDGVKDSHDNASITSTAKSIRSIISLRSLKKRLQFKYSGSDLGDIKSLLGRLTISRSSEQSTSNASEPTFAKPRLSVSIQFSQPVILPGVFPQYCWEHICHNELARCDDIRLPCNRGPIYQPLGQEAHRSIHPNILFRIRTCTIREDDLESMDTFGNSVLHIAASLEAAPSYLRSMIALGSDVHKLNNGDQTFLHLINLSNVAILRDLPALLGALVKQDFNFEQQDHNGQTALHALTQHTAPWKVLSSIIQSFQFHGIPLPAARDNRGYTVAEQLRLHNFKLGWPYYQDPSSSPNITQKPSITPTTITYPKIDPELLKSTTPTALQEYAHHASLLKKIIQSFQNPLYEDGSGRNGLHCLFEVRLDLPTTSSSSTSNPSNSTTTEANIPLEQNTAHLLQLGVDPNQFSKSGHTPIHTLLLHSLRRPPSLNSSLLTLLLSHKANVNLRTRPGLSALHISVSSGNIPATKLLLEHKANIHARTSAGEGVVAFGMKAANKAGDNEGLYARIQACVCLVINEGGVARPTILNEWALGDFRVLTDSEVQAEEHMSEKEESQRNESEIGREPVFWKAKDIASCQGFAEMVDSFSELIG